jgi:hypothetical protein
VQASRCLSDQTATGAELMLTVSQVEPQLFGIPSRK